MGNQQRPKWLLVDRNFHRKNRSGMIRMCEEANIDLTITTNPAEFAGAWEVVYIPCSYVDPAIFSPDTKIVYGPHNFVFVEGIWKTPFPSNCYYNVLSDWVDELEREVGGIGMTTKKLPFPVDIDAFKPTDSSKTLDCFIYFKHRHSRDLALVVKEVESRNLTYKIVQYGSYSEEEFMSTLHQSSFGIWVGSHESQGFALEEALACDVPLLVWNSTTMFDEHVGDSQSYTDKRGVYALRSTSHPYWDDSCGISVDTPDEIGPALERMRQMQFQPRAYIERTLSSAACMDRFVCELGLPRRDLFVITSVINTGQIPWSYAVRSVYSSEERFQQTLQTIESIRLRAPTAKIMLAEGSHLSEEWAAELTSKVDYFLSLAEKADVREACLKSEKKGYGEAVLTKYALEYIAEREIPFGLLFKISGRYGLSAAFSLHRFSRSMFTFKASPTQTSISTVLFSVPAVYRDLFFSIIQDTVDYYRTNPPMGYEMIVPQRCLPRKDVDIVGAQGYVAVNRGERIVV